MTIACHAVWQNLPDEVKRSHDTLYETACPLITAAVRWSVAKALAEATGTTYVVDCIAIGHHSEANNGGIAVGPEMVALENGVMRVHMHWLKGEVACSL